MQKITIIVPVYNCEKTIEKCIDSILKQTYKNFELIVINDGSVDKTLEILQRYNDSRIKIINQLNKGTGFARNIGLKNATGEYICFIDGDDYIKPNFLYCSYELIRKHNANIVAYPYKCRKHRKSEYVLNKEQGMQWLIALPEKIPMSVVGKLFQATAIANLSFCTANKFEDIEFATRAFLNSEKIVFLNDELYCVTDMLNSRSKFYDGDDRIKACLSSIELIKTNCPNLLDDYITYTLLNGIAIINMMIINNNYNSKLLEKIKKTVAQNIKHVKYSHYNITKKTQIYIFHKSFALYKTIYRLFKK